MEKKKNTAHRHCKDRKGRNRTAGDCRRRMWKIPGTSEKLFGLPSGLPRGAEDATRQQLVLAVLPQSLQGTGATGPRGAHRHKLFGKWCAVILRSSACGHPRILLLGVCSPGKPWCVCLRGNQGCPALQASLGHTGRRGVVLGHTFNTLRHAITKQPHRVLSEFMILCWAAITATLGCMLDTPGL